MYSNPKAVFKRLLLKRLLLWYLLDLIIISLLSHVLPSADSFIQPTNKPTSFPELHILCGKPVHNESYKWYFSSESWYVGAQRRDIQPSWGIQGRGVREECCHGQLSKRDHCEVGPKVKSCEGLGYIGEAILVKDKTTRSGGRAWLLGLQSLSSNLGSTTFLPYDLGNDRQNSSSLKMSLS